MLSESQIKRVWEAMLGAEIRANYFAELAGKYQKRQRWATWGSLILSSGAAATVIANLPENWVWVRYVLVLGTAGLSAYSVAMNNQKFAVDSADLHARWNKLAKDYESIWENVYTDDAGERLKAYDDRATELSKAGSGFSADMKSLSKWEDHVVQHRLAQA